ncbi:MAG TPA: hypothetical protein VNJ12_03835 [Candidatus Dormibacteraeota bacterium]|nr:hypothetical protein [Candidatus Dormibacteraeota bacterium]
MTQKLPRFLFIVLLLAPAAARSQSTVARPNATAPAQAASEDSHADFLRAADQVLAQMSRILDLPILHPVRKSVCTKAQIRTYLVQQDQREKHPAKNYADKKALEAFGLIPPHFPLHEFMLNLLTNQIAGFYDPKAQEFYIADWIPLSEQRMVMAHELTHALDDQHFHIEAWLKAARPNDDAQAARQAVLEGSAVASMLDYELLGTGRNIRDMPDIGLLTQAVMGSSSSSPGMAAAPPYLRDSLLFPYLTGAEFTQQVLKAGSGWKDFQKVFARPPVSTQQIMQPALYLAGKAPPPVTLPGLNRPLGRRWKLLDENVAGEFNLQEILKQSLPRQQAVLLAPDWWGDRYAILENKKTKSSLLLFRLRLDTDRHASDFFSAYSDLLRKKHPGAKAVFTAPEFLEFDSAAGGVFLECRADECFSMEGAGRRAFNAVTRAMGWPAAPRPQHMPSSLRGQ